MKELLRQILLGTFLIVMNSTFSIAQVTLMAPELNVENGDLIAIDVEVASFEEIIGMQFTLQWDSTILSFNGVDNFGLPDLNGGHFGTTFSSSGILAVAWIDESLAGVTLADNSAIFTLNFEVIGAGNETTPIAFTSVPTIIEIGNVNGQILDVELQHGLIHVNGVNSTIETTPNDYFSLEQNFPNPFKETTYLPFNLRESANIQLNIYNSYGQLMYEEKSFFLAGKHQLELDFSLFPSTGIYTIKLFTSNFLATKQLIFLN